VVAWRDFASPIKIPDFARSFGLEAKGMLASFALLYFFFLFSSFCFFHFEHRLVLLS
jgi:hypothetical protein